GAPGARAPGAAAAGAEREDARGPEAVGRGRGGAVVGARRVEQCPGARLGQASAHGVTERLEPGCGRDEDAPPAQSAGATVQNLALAHAGNGPGGELADPAQCGDRRPTTEAVRRQPDVALELGHCHGGLLTEDAVFATGVEPERVQPMLELGDVVAPQHRLAEVQGAIPERETALDQRRPRLRAAQPVDLEAALFLEGAYGRFGGGPELARLVRGRVVPEPGESALQVTDGFARRTPFDPRRGHDHRHAAARAGLPTVAAEPELATAANSTVKR